MTRAQPVRAADLGVAHRRGRVGEVHHHVRAVEQQGGVVADRDAERVGPRQGADILPEGDRAAPLGPAHHHHAGGADQHLQQHLAHPPGAADHPYLDRAIGRSLGLGRDWAGGRARRRRRLGRGRGRAAPRPRRPVAPCCWRCLGSRLRGRFLRRFQVDRLFLQGLGANLGHWFGHRLGRGFDGGLAGLFRDHPRSPASTQKLTSNATVVGLTAKGQ